jgi:carbonic anhydrase/acetyltransferase-like protein (isoleucine patch superfamily)
MSRSAVYLTSALAALAVPGSALAQVAAPVIFIDPTAVLVNPGSITISGHEVYVAPFAQLRAGTAVGQTITVGAETNIQDNVVVDATAGPVRLGEQVILAHGATVKSDSEIGETGVCPDPLTVCPSFVGFNAVVDGAVVQKDAMVVSLSRVGPGVTIPSGRKTIPGVNITAQSEMARKTAPLIQGDRDFMNGVITVNREFAVGYHELEHEDPALVRGINIDPGLPGFNDRGPCPSFNGRVTCDPTFRNRIIGDVRMADPLGRLNGRMGSAVSLRADEGTPFIVGTISLLDSQTTFHALEGSSMNLGGTAIYGSHSVVHGGPSPFNPTVSGAGLNLAPWAVLFRSSVGRNVTIGFKSLVQAAQLRDNTVVPECTVIVGTAAPTPVEWCNIQP